MLDKQGRPQTANSVQELQNDSFDPEFRVGVTEMLGVDTSTSPATINRLRVLPDGSISQSLPTSGNNPSETITSSTVGTITTYTKRQTVGSTTYQRTIAVDSADNSIVKSAWSQV